jgi:Holliday junction DNA helicase RuvA
MIAHLTGRLLSKTTQSVIIDAGGIGYEVLVPLSTFYTLPEKDGRVSIHVYTHVREDALLLFGFQSGLEKALFTMLISVSGIGPKLAINVLSGIGPQDLLSAIAKGDALRLQSIPGVGKKTAERIALELKDRASRMMGEYDVTEPSAPMGSEDQQLLDDALSALVNLGYPAKSAKKAIENARRGASSPSIEELIKAALRGLT